MYLSARIIKSNYFHANYLGGFGGIIVSGAYLRYWDGAAWVNKPLKIWNGLTWELKQLKYYNGSSWINVN